jgi:YegS/Rv2252/BmrU family lipid kinase
VSGFTEAGWDVQIHEIMQDEPIPAVTRGAQPESYDLVVAAGGDGTVSGVAGALVGTGVPLGIVPSGTGNSLARDLGIPMRLVEAIKVMTGDHVTRPIDALRVQDSHHFLNLSIGVSAAAMLKTPSSEKRQLGMAAYLLEGVQELTELQTSAFTLTLDDKNFTAEAVDVVVANSGVVGLSVLRLAPNIAVDDGEVSVCIIEAETAMDYITTIWKALLGDGAGETMRCLTARETIVIEADRPLPVQADGEPIGHQAVTAHVSPHAVRVVVPG